MKADRTTLNNIQAGVVALLLAVAFTVPASAHIAAEKHPGQILPDFLVEADCGMDVIIEGVQAWQEVVAEDMENLEEPVIVTPYRFFASTGGPYTGIGHSFVILSADWKVEGEDANWQISDFALVLNEDGCRVGHIHHGWASPQSFFHRLTRAEKVFWITLRPMVEKKRTLAILRARAVSIWENLQRGKQ